MKLTNIILIALFALVVGCGQTAEEQSTGKGEPTGTEKPDADTMTETDAPADTIEGIDAPETEVVKGEAAQSTSVTSKTLVGKYNGAFTEETIKSMIASAPEDQRAMAETQVRASKFSIELHANGSYTLVTTAEHGTETMKGKWEYESDNGVVQIGAPEPTAEQLAQAKAQGATDEQIAARQKEKMPYQVSKDGKTLLFTRSMGGQTVALAFKKA